MRLVEEHAALDVWNNPNSFMARQELVETAQQHLDLTGEGWVLLSHVGAVEWPVELWPIYQHRMSPVPDARAFLAGYVPAGPGGEEVPLKLNEVGLMRAPHPLDVMRGLSAVNALGIDLGTARAARTWNRNFFLNSAEPGGIIEVPRRLSDEEFEEMSARWAEQHRGVSAAHRVAIIEGENTHWIDRKYSMTDMQFVELLGVSDAAVRKAYRYPLSMMGESGDVNRATANAHRAQYALNLLVPRLNRWKGMLNRRFLPHLGPTAGFTGDTVKEAYSLPEALVWKEPAPPPAPLQPGQDDPAGDVDELEQDEPEEPSNETAMAEARRRMLTVPVGWRLRNSAEDEAQIDHKAVQKD